MCEKLTLSDIRKFLSNKNNDKEDPRTEDRQTGRQAGRQADERSDVRSDSIKEIRRETTEIGKLTLSSLTFQTGSAKEIMRWKAEHFQEID